MMVHVADTVEKGHKSVMFPIRDAAVVVLGLTAVISRDGILYGTGKILIAHFYVPHQGVTQHRSFFTGHRQNTAWKHSRYILHNEATRTAIVFDV